MFGKSDGSPAAPRSTKRGIPNPFKLAENNEHTPRDFPVSDHLNAQVEGETSHLHSIAVKKGEVESPFRLDTSPEALRPPLGELDGFALPHALPELEIQPAQIRPRALKRQEMTLDDDPFDLPKLDHETSQERRNLHQRSDDESFNQGSEDPQTALQRMLEGELGQAEAQELLEKASLLPGLLKVQVLERRDVDAIRDLRSCLNRLNLGEPDSLVISTHEGILDVVESCGVSLLVLRKGDYEVGVRDCMIAVAEKLGGLGS